MSAFTLYEKRNERWLEIFDALWSGIVGSVVIIWFGFQLKESVMGAYQSFLDYREARLQKARDEAEERGHREERERILKRLELLREKGVSEEVIQEAKSLSSSLKNER